MGERPRGHVLRHKELSAGHEDDEEGRFCWGHPPRASPGVVLEVHLDGSSKVIQRREGEDLPVFELRAAVERNPWREGQFHLHPASAEPACSTLPEVLLGQVLVSSGRPLSPIPRGQQMWSGITLGACKLRVHMLCSSVQDRNEAGVFEVTSDLKVLKPRFHGLRREWSPQSTPRYCQLFHVSLRVLNVQHAIGPFGNLPSGDAVPDLLHLFIEL
mmetsp:Transcript_39683/g.84833  ORF Transcript_39683/g.84833 Transcript_39683/m.84833 type:complete len:215 (+) Transcript_39683:645-1289(+)